MKLLAPIIVIGCGRSGSTLLDRVLNAHPEIHMIGETRFLTARLWKTLNECADGSMWNSAVRLAYRYRNAAEGQHQLPDDDEWTEIEGQRVASIVNRTVADLFVLDEVDKRFWGMKEIWNGGMDDIGWDIYDLVFPDATWVHVVRDPLGYVRSALGWKETTPTYDEVRHQLQTWMRILGKSRDRRATGRFVEIRYEDLVASPERALGALLERLELEWHGNCRAPLRHDWVATRRLPVIDPGWFAECVAEFDLAPTLGELGYSATADPEQATVSYSMAVERDGRGNLVIDAHVERGMGPYWLFVLSKAPAIMDALAADGFGAPSLNAFTLLEDGRPLRRLDARVELFKGPPGCYFSNSAVAFFTSTDGTEPVKNGRRYSICPA